MRRLSALVLGLLGLIAAWGTVTCNVSGGTLAFASFSPLDGAAQDSRQPRGRMHLGR